MAEALAVLIKLAAYKVEQAQGALATAQKARDAAQANLIHWQNAGFEGYKTAMESGEMGQLQFAGAFLKRAKQEELKAKEVLAKRESETEQARLHLSECYTAQKRFEMLHEKQRQAAKKRRAAKQQASLEDIASQKFHHS